MKFENGLYDMSSNEPHVTVDCPVCDKMWMKKVVDGEYISECGCKLKYAMRDTPDGVQISFRVPNDKLKRK